MGDKLKKLGNVGKKDNQANRVYAPSGISTSIKAVGGGGGAKTGLYQVKAVLTPDRAEKRQNGRRMKENGEPSFTLTGQDIHGVQISPCLNPNDLRKGYSGQNKQSMNKTGMIRRLTPTECERLQGFPDAWTEGLSDTQRYKTLGNAVSVPVVKAVVERLIRK